MQKQSSTLFLTKITPSEFWQLQNSRKNLLMKAADSFDDYIFGSSYLKKNIERISFIDTLSRLPENNGDISADRSGRVRAWIIGKELFIAANGTIHATSCRSLFADYINVKEIHFNGCFNTENVQDMSEMFINCTSLESLDLRDFNTSNVSNMKGMFEICSSLKTLNISSFNTYKVTNMHGMFMDCKSLELINLRNFNTSMVTDMCEMFSGCETLAYTNISHFNTSNVLNMAYMFYNCNSLISIDISNFNISKVTRMDNMFANCYSLVSIPRLKNIVYKKI